MADRDFRTGSTFKVDGPAMSLTLYITHSTCNCRLINWANYNDLTQPRLNRLVETGKTTTLA